jgi:hypothetical protein
MDSLFEQTLGPGDVEKLALIRMLQRSLESEPTDLTPWHSQFDGADDEHELSVGQLWGQ